MWRWHPRYPLRCGGGIHKSLTNTDVAFLLPFRTHISIDVGIYNIIYHILRRWRWYPHLSLEVVGGIPTSFEMVEVASPLPWIRWKWHPHLT